MSTDTAGRQPLAPDTMPTAEDLAAVLEAIQRARSSLNLQTAPSDRPTLVPAGLLTTEEVAAVYRTSPSTVRYWRNSDPPKGPPSFRCGRRVLYDSADVRDHLNSLQGKA